MKIIIGYLLAFASFAACAQNTPTEYKLFTKESDRLTAQRQANKISRTEMLKEKLAAARTYMPNDRVTEAFITSLITYSEQLDQHKITQQEYQALEAARSERFTEAIKDLNAEEDRLAQQRPAPQMVYYGGGGAVNDAIPTAVFLNRIGTAFSTSFGQSLTPPPRICMYGQGNSMCY